MSESSLVSVVVPAYKAARLLPQALDSICAQTHPNWETIVVEDGILDGTDEVLRAFQRKPGGERFKFLRHEKNLGPSDARNTGMRAARGDFIAFLDHDDVWRPEYLERMLGAIADRRAAAGFCRAQVFDDATGRPIELFGPSAAEWERFPGSLFYRNFITPSATVMRRDVAARVGEFSPAPRGCEDHDYWLRAIAAGFKVTFVDEVLCRYRRGAGQLTSQMTLMHKSDAIVMRRNWRYPELPLRRRLRHASSVHERLSFTLFRSDPRAARKALFLAWLFWPVRLDFLFRAARLRLRAK